LTFLLGKAGWKKKHGYLMYYTAVFGEHRRDYEGFLVDHHFENFAFFFGCIS